MKNNVLTVMKKECARIYGDKKLFFTVVLLPGLLMFVMYTLMGSFMNNMFVVEEEYIYEVYAVNLPDSIAGLLPADEFEIRHITMACVERVKQEITDRETDLLVIFPPQFMAEIADFDPEAAAELGIIAPNIQVWSNFARTESGEASSRVTAILRDYHHSLTHRFTVNAPSDAAPDGNYNLATEADLFAMVLGMIIPLLFIIFIFQGCQSIAPESIAGEKERGTLGPMLVTPANRRDLALGKILGIGVFALMSAVVSIVGALLAMPALIMMDSGSVFEFYSVGDFALLFLVATSTTLVFVAVLSVLSAYAKSVKEATAYSMPIMLIVFVAGLSGMVFNNLPETPIFYLIPVMNSALSITAIFSFEINAANILITSAVNFGLAIGFTALLAWIFSSEKIVFDK